MHVHPPDYDEREHVGELMKGIILKKRKEGRKSVVAQTFPHVARTSLLRLHSQTQATGIPFRFSAPVPLR